MMSQWSAEGHRRVVRGGSRCGERVRSEQGQCASGEHARYSHYVRAFVLTPLLLQKWKMFWPTFVSSVNR